MFSSQEISQLNDIIDKHIVMFNGRYISPDLLTAEEKAILSKQGVDWRKIDPSETLIYQSFAMGIMSGAIPKGVLSQTAFNEFRTYLKSGKFIPLNTYEKAVIRSLEQQSLSDIRGIKNRFVDKIADNIAAANRKYYEDTIRRSILEGRAKKEGIRVISAEINKQLGDFSRDFDRVVQYVSNTAFQEGRAAFYERHYENDPIVFKTVYDGACKHCIRLYLTGGLGSKPQLFKLSSLRANGTNIGKKVEDWMPVVGSTHPYCRCQLHVVPSGFIWSEEKKSFIPDKNRKRVVERKSKIKFTFGDKDYVI